MERASAAADGQPVGRLSYLLPTGNGIIRTAIVL